MKQVHREIRKAYFTLLNGNIEYNGNPVPVYKSMLPKGADDSLYVLMGQQQGFPDNTKQSFNTDANIQLTVISSEIGTNDGDAVEDVAQQILNIIYPSRRGCVLSGLVSGFEAISTELVSDVEPDPIFEGERVILTRFIQFEHRTMQKSF